MGNTQLVERFILNEVVGRNLELKKPRVFRTHTQLLLDAASRRGWSTEELSKGLYSIYDGQHLLGVLQQMITSLTSSTAVSICSRKHVTRKFFTRQGVTIAPGASFLGSQWSEANQYFEDAQKPLVVKPSRGAAGKGISTNVMRKQEFEDAWKKALDSQTSEGAVVVEQQVPGIDGPDPRKVDTGM